MKRRYVISFGGLSDGKHEYEYQLNDKFFEQFEYSEITKGDMRVDVRLIKQSVMLLFEFIIRGTATQLCDRCGDDCEVAVRGEYQFTVKVGGGEQGEQEDILTLPTTGGDIDIAQYLYEYCVLSLPAKRTHEKESDCDPESIKKLKEIDVTEKENTVDPRWEALKKIKFNN